MDRCLFEHVFSIPILDGGDQSITMPVHGQLLTKIDQQMYHIKQPLELEIKAKACVWRTL